jgi:uncharacterized protein (DUF2164 family)
MSDKSYTPTEFAEAEQISRGQLYKLWSLGLGPRYYTVGVNDTHRRITEKARQEWHREREASQQGAA